MSSTIRNLLLRLLDSGLIILTGLLTLWFTETHKTPETVQQIVLYLTIAMLVFHHIYAIIFRLYQKVWSYASVGELVAIFKVTVATALSTMLVQLLMNDWRIFPRTLIIATLFYVLFIGGSRFCWRVFRDYYFKAPKKDASQRALIVGAGAAGSMIARQLVHEQTGGDIIPIGFIDDDMNKQKMHIYDVPVLGRVADIAEVVSKYQINLIVIAIPSLQNGELNYIVEECSKTKVPVQMLPKIEDLMTGKISVSNLRNIEIEDLLGRKPVELDMNSISDSITGEVIMVTGAGGSIGSELCRQLIRFSPSKLLLVGHGEYSIYKIEQDLKMHYDQHDVELLPIIGDVKDRNRMETIISTYRPKKIYHAAAHKHVPLMEHNPHESVKNNVIGTKNVAELADKYHVDTFVLVSTDKAVNPTNVMGASKRIAEMVVQELAQRSKTKFVAVRFGNVLGSRGSVIPLFRQQISEGGPITVTHPDITRYFMTIPEASRLVIQAGTLARGGEIFVLDMGEPVKIVDLAKRLIQLSGYEIDEIGIEYTGLRDGEKMFEELLNENEVNPKQVFEKIYIGRTALVNNDEIITLIETFQTLDNHCLKETMMRIIGMEQEMKEEMNAIKTESTTMTKTVNA